MFDNVSNVSSVSLLLEKGNYRNNYTSGKLNSNVINFFTFKTTHNAAIRLC